MCTTELCAVTERRVVQTDELPKLIAPHSAVRALKIEASGDFWKGLTKPKIRLMGHWLERAGFKPGNRVHVICVASGVIELRSHGAVDD
jgi:hypothetical protein